MRKWLSSRDSTADLIIDEIFHFKSENIITFNRNYLSDHLWIFRCDHICLFTLLFALLFTFSLANISATLFYKNAQLRVVFSFFFFCCLLSKTLFFIFISSAPTAFIYASKRNSQVFAHRFFYTRQFLFFLYYIYFCLLKSHIKL